MVISSAGDEPAPAGSTHLLDDAALDRFAADARIDEARRERARESGLRRSAAEESSLAGLLLDLGERAQPVLATTSTHRHRGCVDGVGRDYVTLRTGHGRRVSVSLSALASIRSDRGAPHVEGSRAQRVDHSMADLLADLADVRARLHLVCVGGTDIVTGELRSVGRDVVVLRLDDGAGLAYVPLASVAEFSATASG